jgi:hypothetical protein
MINRHVHFENAPAMRTLENGFGGRFVATLRAAKLADYSHRIGSIVMSAARFGKDRRPAFSSPTLQYSSTPVAANPQLRPAFLQRVKLTGSDFLGYLQLELSSRTSPLYSMATFPAE